MNTQLTAQQKRIIKRARKCGVLGFTSIDLFTTWDIARLTALSKQDLDDLDAGLENLQALLKGLRSPN